MKKFLIIFFSVILLSGCIKTELEPFMLETKYIGRDEFMELDGDKLNTLIENKESFAVFLFQPFCEAAANFNDVLIDFMSEYKIGIYKMQFKDIKGTELDKHVKYYPSLVIYKDGKLVSFLEADKDEDTKSFKYKDEFVDWFSQYVIIEEDETSEESESLDEVNNNEIVDNNQQVDNIYQEQEKIDVELPGVVYNKNKVNIYLFWGDGCPHCENEKEFFEKIEKEYGQYYTLHTYEVWYNDDNQNIFNQFASAMGDNISGVPYTIIGNKSFKGFNESYEEELLKAITSQYKNSYDVYLNVK